MRTGGGLTFLLDSTIRSDNYILLGNGRASAMDAGEYSLFYGYQLI